MYKKIAMPALPPGITMDHPAVILLEKVIFPTGKTEKQIAMILDAEIIFFEDANPGYSFDNIVGKKKNPDGSVTVAIGFKISSMIK